MTFGMKASVCSWIWVTAWKIDTSRPTARPAPSIGIATLKASVRAVVARLTTTSWVMRSSVEALDERSGDEVPAVDQDEEQDLERQRDEDRGQHHHAHRHQRRADDQVDDQERQEDQEADLERRLELGDRERRDQHGRRDVLARLDVLEVRKPREQRDVLLTRLVEHELAHRLFGALERDLLGDGVLLQRVVGVVLDLLERRAHHEQRQEERDADEHLIRRRRRRAEPGADEAEDDEDAGEAGDGEQQGRDERDAADEQQQLDGVARVGLHFLTVLARSASRKPLTPGCAGVGSPWMVASVAGTGSSSRRPIERASSSLKRRIGVTPCSAVPMSTTSPPARIRCSARLPPSGRVASDSRPAPEAPVSLEALTCLRTQ